MKNKKIKNILARVVMVFFVLQLMVPVILFYPQKVSAQADAASTAATITQTGLDVEGRVSTEVKDISEKVEKSTMERIKEGLILSAAITLRNTLVSMARDAATQSYEWITTGDWGEGPMFYEQAWGKFQDDIMTYTVGRFLENLQGMAWDQLGFDICDPGSEAIKLNIVLGLDKYANIDQKREVPDCTWENLSKNWTSFYGQIETMAGQFKDQPFAASMLTLQKTLDVSFDRKSSDIGVYLTLEDQLTRQQQKAVTSESRTRVENLGSKSITNLIGDTIKTPAFLTRGHMTDETQAMSEAQQDEVKASENVIDDIPAAVAGAFLSTFVSKGFTDLMNKKFFEEGLVKTSQSYQPKDNLYDQKKQVSQDIQKIKTVNFSYSTKQIDLLTEFTSCPKVRQINNCVMDDNFSAVVRKASQDKPLTVSEAIASGAIRGDLPLISENDGRNKNDDCYQTGYCYSNLVKLRKARIIPIGWEIAANRVGDKEIVSLQFAIDQFNVGSGVEGAANYNKFYHLIDPSWVLKYPATQCKASVYGPMLVAAGTESRAETCVDMPSCVQTDDNGKCLSWGYCAAEKNIFRLGGEQCNGVYDSCRTLEDRKGKNVNYVTNTLDRTGCDANGVGCKWYATTMTRQSGIMNWNSAGERILLNKNIEDKECSPNDEGCTRFVRTKAGIGTNLVPNGDFEEIYTGTPDDNNPDTVPAWGNAGQILTVGARAGKNSFKTGTINLPVISIAPKNFTRYFAVSAEVKKLPANVSAEIGLTAVNLQIIPVANSIKSILNTSAIDVWTTVYTIYQVSPQVGVAASNPIASLQFKLNVVGGPILLDNVMVEELEVPALTEMSQFNSYANTNSTLNTFLKKAPDYLNCYDTTVAALNGKPKIESDINSENDVAKATGNKGCSDFAQLCTASDVGCQSYKPTDRGRTATGVVSFADYCPQECAGYQTYSQGGTYFENPAFPIYLISTTAKTCNASNVGCDEFTNLDVLAAGGESKEYYSELRKCQKLPEGAALCGNYYTWVGDKTKGYQLQAYNLKKSLVEAYPGPAVAAGVNEAQVLAAMSLVCNAEVFAAKSNPDCLEFYDSSGGISYRLLSKVVTCSENCHPYRRTVKYNNQAECEALNGRFDAGECIFMAIPGEGKKCSASAAGCREYKGNFAGDETVIYENNFSNGDISAIQGFTTQPVTMADGQYLSVKFQPGYVASWFNTKPELVSINVPGEYTLSFWSKGNGELSPLNVELKEANQTLLTLGSSVNTSANWQFNSFNFVVTPELAEKQLVVYVWDHAEFYVDNFKIVKNDDKKYLIKDSWSTPTTCDNPLVYTPDAAIPRSLPQAQLGCREYKDAENNTMFLKSFSSLCTADKVGCEALIDTKNSVTPFEQGIKDNICNGDAERCISAGWEQICSTSHGVYPMVGGCANVTDIVNNFLNEWRACYPDLYGRGARKTEAESRACEAPIIKKYLCLVNGNNWDVSKNICFTNVSSADSFVYLVNSKDKQCKNTEKGCMALGLPNLTVNAQGAYVVAAEKSWNKVFYKLDPETFATESSPFCAAKEIGCEEYKDDKGSSFYFKDPGKKVCEYRKLSSGTSYGWYIKKEKSTDADVLCPSVTSYYGDGVQQVKRMTDPAYTGWTGLCKSDANKCTAFVDPTDKSLSNAGKAYYYINDENIDKGSCSGVSRKEGCVLFNDTSMVNDKGEADLTWSTGNTYLNSEKEKGNLVTPVTGGGLAKVLQDRNMLNAVMAADVCSDGPCLAFEDMINSAINNNETDWDVGEFVGRVNPAVCSVKKVDCSRKRILDKFDGKDANVIIKTVRDRECANWYACKSSHFAWDVNKNKYTEICDNFGLCDKLSADEDVLNCAHFVQTSNSATNLLAKNKKLQDGYQTRNTSWFDIDYSGMSIPNLAPIYFYSAFDILQGTQQQAQASRCGGAESGKLCPNGDIDCSGGVKCLPVQVADKKFRLVDQLLGTSCVKQADCNASCASFLGVAANVNNCKCLSGVCVVPAKGATFNPAQGEETFAPECRAYPQENTPFPANVSGNQFYSRAKTMYVESDSGHGDEDFGCYYREVKYGGGAIVKYMPKSADYTPPEEEGFCQDQPDLPCNCTNTDARDRGGMITKSMCSSSTCSDPGTNMLGTCMRKDRTKAAIDYSGWQGYCLEKDKSLKINNSESESPCLTWYPAESMAGLQDLQNQFADAGFNIDNYDAGPYYCTASETVEYRSTYIKADGGYRDCDGGEEMNGWRTNNSGDPRFDPAPLASLPNVNDNHPGYAAYLTRRNTVVGVLPGETGIHAGSDDGRDNCWDGRWGSPTMLTADVAWGCIMEGGGGSDCNTQDDTTVNRTPACEKNYHPGFMLRAEQTSIEEAGGDYDRFSFIYDCLPNNTSYETDRQDGWFKDNGGGAYVSDTIGNVQLAALKPAEKQQSNCTELYQVGNSGESKAFTNKWYKKQLPAGTAVAPANVSLNLGCAPYGALNKTSAINVANVDNFLLYNFDAPISCPNGGAAGPVYDGGVQIFNGGAQLKDLFAKTYGKYSQRQVSGERIGRCKTELIPDLLGQLCLTTAYCQTLEGADRQQCIALLCTRSLDEWCMGFELRKCNNTAPANEQGTLCFTDQDCGAVSRVKFDSSNWTAEKSVCTSPYLATEQKPNVNIDIKKGDANAANYVNNCNAQGGTMLPANWDNQAVAAGTKLSCEKNMYANGTACNKGDKRVSSDANATCEGLAATSYPSWDHSKVGYYQDNNPDPDRSDTLSHTIPQIAAVVPTGRKDNKDNPIYGAMLNALTVNGQTSGDIVGSGGSAEVSVKFYGWANDDQMPIRNIRMKWGLEAGVPSGDGKYQNHKPRCQRVDKELLGLCGGVIGFACKDATDCPAGVACNGAEDRFGDTAKVNAANACVESYFQYNHTFNCEDPDAMSPALVECPANDTTMQACKTNYQGKRACRFRIGAQLTDNWEWCTGGGYGSRECTQDTRYQFYGGFVYIPKP